jgi:hypothetical protein
MVEPRRRGGAEEISIKKSRFIEQQIAISTPASIPQRHVASYVSSTQRPTTIGFLEIGRRQAHRPAMMGKRREDHVDGLSLPPLQDAIATSRYWPCRHRGRKPASSGGESVPASGPRARRPWSGGDDILLLEQRLGHGGDVEGVQLERMAVEQAGILMPIFWAAG